jgi:hypothetical protein
MLFIFSLLLYFHTCYYSVRLRKIEKKNVELQKEKCFYLYRLVFLQFCVNKSCKNRRWNKGKRFLHGFIMINGGNAASSTSRTDDFKTCVTTSRRISWPLFLYVKAIKSGAHAHTGRPDRTLSRRNRTFAGFKS